MFTELSSVLLFRSVSNRVIVFLKKKTPSALQVPISDHSLYQSVSFYSFHTCRCQCQQLFTLTLSLNIICRSDPLGRLLLVVLVVIALQNSLLPVCFAALISSVLSFIRQF